MLVAYFGVCVNFKTDPEASKHRRLVDLFSPDRKLVSAIEAVQLALDRAVEFSEAFLNLANAKFLLLLWFSIGGHNMTA